MHRAFDELLGVTYSLSSSEVGTAELTPATFVRSQSEFRRKCELPWSPLFTQGEFERPPRTGIWLPPTKAIRCSARGIEAENCRPQPTLPTLSTRPASASTASARSARP